jgi:hexosaminidase
MQMALAERAWHQAAWELPHQAGREFNATTTHVDKAAMKADYCSFVTAVVHKELGKLDAIGIQVGVSVHMQERHMSAS